MSATLLLYLLYDDRYNTLLGGRDSHLQIAVMIVIACKTLLKLADFQQVVFSNTPAKLAHQCDMFRHIARKLSKLGIVFHKALHVRD